MKTQTATVAESKRAYRQGARAEAAARTGEAIVAALGQFLMTDWYDDIGLERIASEAGVTVQTVLRRFGSKEGVLQAFSEQFEADVNSRRVTLPDDIDACIASLVADYEAVGDITMRVLAQETRIPAIKTMTDKGRDHHRDWVRQCFAPHLAGLDPEQKEWQLDGLVVALDIYVWAILRRDRGRTPQEVAAYMKTLVCAMIGPDTPAR